MPHPVLVSQMTQGTPPGGESPDLQRVQAPPIRIVISPSLVLPFYPQLQAEDNPFHISDLSPEDELAQNGPTDMEVDISHLGSPLKTMHPESSLP